MARTQIVAVSADKDGATLAAASAGDVANGNYVNNSGQTRLVVTNTSGSTPYNFTIGIPTLVDGKAVTSRIVPMAANAVKFFGPYPTNIYGNQLLIDCENASLTVRALECG